MELAAGYKQTAIGILPTDWDVKSLDAFAHVTSGKRLPLGSSLIDTPTPHPYVRVTDMEPGTVSLKEIKFVPEHVFPAIKRYRIYNDDIFISVAGTLGIVGKVPAELNGANLTENANRITDIKCSRDFLLHVLMSPLVQMEIESIRTVGAQPKLALTRIRKFAIPLPPRISEQDAIATALDNVDALLDGLDRLIAKKRDLKQAAMQQLLTAETRLPGFDGDWEKTSFADTVRHHAGNSSMIKGKLPSSQTGGLFPGFSASGQDVWVDHFDFEGDAIVVSAVGSRCGKTFFASGKWCAIANTHVVWADLVRVNMRFLNYLINDENFWLKGGSGQPFVMFRQTFAKSFILPSIQEQIAIVGVLSDIDIELKSLEIRRTKTRALKQGMMQELLTGRTRLV